MQIFKHVYDNPKNNDGTNKPNELLGDFDLLDGDMNDYSYDVIVRSKADGKVYILHGKEVSDYYHPNLGGTRNYLEPLTENYFVKMYLKFK